MDHSFDVLKIHHLTQSLLGFLLCYLLRLLYFYILHEVYDLFWVNFYIRCLSFTWTFTFLSMKIQFLQPHCLKRYPLLSIELLSFLYQKLGIFMWIYVWVLHLILSIYMSLPAISHSFDTAAWIWYIFLNSTFTVIYFNSIL